MNIKRYKRNPDVVHRTVQGQVMILDPYDGKLHTLNAIAARIWKLLWKSKTEDEIVKVLLSEYDVTEHEVQSDVATFIKKSLRAKLIIVS